MRFLGSFTDCSINSITKCLSKLWAAKNLQLYLRDHAPDLCSLAQKYNIETTDVEVPITQLSSALSLFTNLRQLRLDEVLTPPTRFGSKMTSLLWLTSFQQLRFLSVASFQGPMKLLWPALEQLPLLDTIDMTMVPSDLTISANMPSLSRLYLAASNVIPVTITAVSLMPSLTHLDLSMLVLQRGALVQLSKSTTLISLSLTSTKFNVPEIAKLTTLRELCVGYSAMKHYAVLSQLKELKNLEIHVIDNDRVAERELEVLKEKLPLLVIRRI